ncbi:hypothetical protein D9611_005146 [Ephemerocybe angulata]|uniref:Diphthamide biosynthesis protein 3 n=1 Tax=Ephemerocybe angulata TaxID=980116 RepID=A0A8H5C217_9AGAR|nr:hypothetical protein D9611_005146 [Tulosesus angulatus]
MQGLGDWQRVDRQAEYHRVSGVGGRGEGVRLDVNVGAMARVDRKSDQVNLSPRPRPFFAHTVLVKLDQPQDTPSFYEILSIPQNATAAEVKAAYHRALLQHHPDKQSSAASNGTSPVLPRAHHSSTSPLNISSGSRLEISLIKLAYETLLSPESRGTYDSTIMKKRKAHTTSGGPRPAQIISLEDWVSTSRSKTPELHEGGEDVEGEEEGPWRYPCRCSGFYEISVDMMERGVHLVGCNSCSEVVWAGYELEEDADLES